MLASVDSAPRPQNNWLRLLLLALLLAAFGLRLQELTRQDIWWDEARNIDVALRPFLQVATAPELDIQPPVYYWLLHGWNRALGIVAGQPASQIVFAGRLLSVFFGVLGVALLHTLGRRGGGPLAGVIAALVGAAAPFWLAESQETRMYTVGFALLAGAAVMFLGRDWRLETSDPRSPISALWPPTSGLKSPVSAFLPLALVALWSAAWIGGEAWFRWHESKAPLLPTMWTISPPSPEDNAREVPIAERTLDVLLFPDTAYSEQWRGDNGWQWQAFYFHWPPGPTSVQSAFIVHDPRVCLGAAGFELEAKLPTWTAEANGFRLPFQRYLFRDRGRPVHVFHAVVEDDGTPSGVDNEFSLDRNVRWENLLAGRRNRGLRVLEFAVRGPLDPATAEAAAQQWLDRRLVADKPSDK